MSEPLSARIAKAKAWHEDMPAVDALAHIIWRLHSLLYGIDSQQSLDECQQAADVWVEDVAPIIASAEKHADQLARAHAVIEAARVACIVFSEAHRLLEAGNEEAGLATLYQFGETITELIADFDRGEQG